MVRVRVCVWGGDIYSSVVHSGLCPAAAQTPVSEQVDKLSVAHRVVEDYLAIGKNGVPDARYNVEESQTHHANERSRARESVNHMAPFTRNSRQGEIVGTESDQRSPGARRASAKGAFQGGEAVLRQDRDGGHEIAHD